MTPRLKPIAPFPRPTRGRAITTSLLLTITAIATITYHQPVHHTATLPLKPCGHIILITAARHGSTWFISSAEGCTAKNSSSFGHLNRDTELWMPDRQGYLYDVSPRDAVEYVRHNSSVKVMPLSRLRREGASVKQFLTIAKDTIPVFVLRRKNEDSLASLVTAKETGTWAKNKVEVGDRTTARSVVVEENKLEKYERRIQTYFDELKYLLEKVGAIWDEVWYEDVSESEVIVGPRNRCFIKNCNFL